MSSRTIYSMTDAELQAENASLRNENDRLCKALADMAEENAELRAKYEGLVYNIKTLGNRLKEEQRDGRVHQSRSRSGG